MRDLEAVIEEKIRQDGPVGFDVLVSAAQTTPDAAEEAIHKLQKERKVAYSGRLGGYVAPVAECPVCGHSLQKTTGRIVRIHGPDVADADVPEEEYTLHSRCYEAVFGNWSEAQSSGDSE